MEEYNSANDDGAPRGMSGMGRGVAGVVAAGGRSLTAARIKPRLPSPLSLSSAGGPSGGRRRHRGRRQGVVDCRPTRRRGGGTRPVYLQWMIVASGAFLHLALFHAWSDAICNNKKPLIEFPVDCLIGKYALPVVYFVAGWMLYSASKAATIAADKRPFYFMFAALHTHVMRERQGR
jgi:hypothetical protein